MNKELQDWYENQFEMFSTKGWKDFVAKAEQIRDDYDSVPDIKTAEQLFRVKGILENLNWILGWEDMVNMNYKLLSEEE